MSVVNVRVVNIRREGYADLRAWIADDAHNVYVGRCGIVFINGARFPSHGSPFANPFRIIPGKMTRADCIRQYETYIRAEMARDPALIAQLIAMRGKRLGCWCHPEACHADVLLRLIEEFAHQ